MALIGLTPAVTDLRVLRHGVLLLTFADGLEGEVDLIDRLWGPAFERARTPAGFAEVYVDEELGTIAWPGEVDLAPDALYVRVRTGRWPTGPDWPDDE